MDHEESQPPDLDDGADIVVQIADVSATPAGTSDEPKKVAVAKRNVETARDNLNKWRDEVAALSGNGEALQFKQRKSLEGYEKKVAAWEAKLKTAEDNLASVEKKIQEDEAKRKEAQQKMPRGMSVAAVRTIVRLRLGMNEFANTATSQDAAWRLLADRFNERIRNKELPMSDARIWTALKTRYIDEQAAFRLYSERREAMTASGVAVDDLDREAARYANDTTDIFRQFDIQERPMTVPGLWDSIGKHMWGPGASCRASVGYSIGWASGAYGGAQ